ncbi:hypothetical protein JOB18_030098 [Solea senegalensis]|uniref:Uncharacterized protein n=1 Tax=Solea senegalensis TaxID=28829 RepID=A0AAV6PRP0_SOLSE|nr:hypothetical protein JOB18_030098 [Solea senegalensis]
MNTVVKSIIQYLPHLYETFKRNTTILDFPLKSDINSWLAVCYFPSIKLFQSRLIMWSWILARTETENSLQLESKLVAVAVARLGT